MKSIIWGVVIIAIGLIRGDSVFRGDFTIVSILFDALGVFFIIRGVITIYQAKRAESVLSAPPPPGSPPPRR